MIELDKRRTALLIADFYADMMGKLPHAVSRDCISRTQALRQAARDAGLHQRRLFLLLAEIAEAEGAVPGAGRAELRLAAEADPDSAWHCDSCQAVFPVWHGACPTCTTPGSLRWKVG